MYIRKKIYLKFNSIQCNNLKSARAQARPTIESALLCYLAAIT